MCYTETKRPAPTKDQIYDYTHDGNIKEAMRKRFPWFFHPASVQFYVQAVESGMENYGIKDTRVKHSDPEDCWKVAIEQWRHQLRQEGETEITQGFNDFLTWIKREQNYAPVFIKMHNIYLNSIDPEWESLQGTEEM